MYGFDAALGHRGLAGPATRSVLASARGRIALREAVRVKQRLGVSWNVGADYGTFGYLYGRYRFFSGIRCMENTRNCYSISGLALCGPAETLRGHSRSGAH